MKIKHIQLAIILALIFIFGQPCAVSADDYPVGSFIKSSRSPIVYYVASDKHKYPFPDEATFLSWNDNFSGITIASARDMLFIPSSKKSITARPGVKLVKFANSPKVYVVESGAVLRWLKSEKIAAWYYGKNWKNQIMTLSLDQMNNYTFGQDLNTGDKFSKTKVVLSASNVNDELQNRNALVTGKNTIRLSASANANDASLKTIKENLQSGLSPRFNYTLSSYNLIAEYDEKILTLQPVPFNKEAIMSVNGTIIKNGSPINLELRVGINNFDIKITAPNGQSITYYLYVTRENPGNNSLLKSLTENLKGNLSPAFNQAIYKYDIRAEYNENIIVINAAAEDEKTNVIINGDNTAPNYKKTATIALNYGDNIIEVKTLAENGSIKTYKITVNRTKFPALDATDLLSISENLVHNIEPNFDANMTRYFLRANPTEDRVVIKAQAKNKSAYVFIDGIQTNSRTIFLEEGEENKIEIVVKINGGFEKKYLLSVYRESL